MATKKQQQDSLKAKQKRQKIIAGVGGVLLLALLAFQVPRTMKMLNAKAPAPPPAAAAPTSVPTDPSILPTPGAAGGAAPAAGGASGGTLIDSDAAPTAATGQLLAFGRFASKDPFSQQIDPRATASSRGSTPAPKRDDATGTPAPPSSAPDAGITSPAGGGSSSGSSGSSGAPSSGSSSPTTPGVAAGSALISVNGTEEVVARGASFPKESPVFTLVSIAKGRANVAIAGGAFASGARTIPLTQGKTTTLVNTADGTRYELKLVAVGA